MPARENVLQVLKNLVLPELHALRSEVAGVQQRLGAIEKRMDDFASRFQAVDEHLVDQSRRIDGIRSELGGRIDEVRTELGGRIDQQTARIDQLSARIDEVRTELGARIDQQTARIDQVVAQGAEMVQQIGILRRDREVTDDLIRRVRRLEERAA